jgi:hypothetical protein
MKEENKIIILLIIADLFLAGAIWLLVSRLAVRLPEVFVQIPYSPANIVVDTQATTGPVNQFYLGFAQGGEEAKNMLSPAVEKMKVLKPRYIRLDHIFDDDYYGVVSGSSGNLKFNFGRLDETVASIQAMGAKPFFSLGYMPSAVASSKISIPYNWNDWYTITKALVEHYSGRKAIEGVYYEVWNEPDLELFGGWKRSGEKNYLLMYDYAVRGAMSAEGVKPFYIGGPATTGLYENWIKDLYNYCAKKSLRLDFLSWHRYSLNPYQYFQDVNDVYFWLSGRPIPQLVISEWGPKPEKSNLYSSRYSAVFSLAVVRQLLDNINLITVFEVKDGPGQGDQGWGLLGHEESGLAIKPRYWAFQWLSEVDGERLQMSGEGSNVSGWATRDSQKIKLYLVNFGEKAVTENIPVEIRSLTPGKWQITKEVLFGQKETMELNLTSNVFQTSLKLEPNEAGRITLVKI